MDRNLSPIALFAFRRPDHTKRVLESLSRNAESANSDLIVFIDGPNNSEGSALTDAVLSVVKETSGFKSVEIHQSTVNLGLANSIIQGVSRVIEQHGRVIVLEDDIVVSSHFLKYMNDALWLYESDDKVASVHGYVYPVNSHLPETFFLRGADCWGWGTWDRAWQVFNPNGRELMNELLGTNQIHEFDFDGSANYLDMLRGQIKGRNDSWAVRWYASAFLADMLTLYPGKSLVRNIGLDGSGEHCDVSDVFDSVLFEDELKVNRIDCLESREARTAFADFFRSSQIDGGRKKLRQAIRKAQSLLGMRL